MVGYHHIQKREDGKYQGSYDQGPNQWMTWADRNGDGKMSADEISLAKDLPILKGIGRVAAGRLDPELNVHLKMGSDDYLLPPKEILPHGVPVYDWSMVRKTVLTPPSFVGGDGIKVVSGVDMPMPLAADDGMYAVVKAQSPKNLDLPGIDGSGWWASRNWRNKLVKFDKNTGEPLWAVGRRAPGLAEAGQMYCPISVSGKAGDAVFVADALSVVWVWHTDGLYLGRLFRDHHAGPSDVPVDQELYGEIQSTFVFNDPQSGKAYHVGTGNETRIHELIMPVVQRLPAVTVTLGAEDAKAARPWDPDGMAPTEKPSIVATPAPGNASGCYPVKLDGDFDGREGWDGWNGVSNRPMLVMMDGRTVGTVRAMYDAENLYLGYNVVHSSGPANSGSELPFAPFVSGAYVDFSIASDWSKPQRRNVLEGDLRVIIARVSNGAAGGEANFQQGFWQTKPVVRIRRRSPLPPQRFISTRSHPCLACRLHTRSARKIHAAERSNTPSR